MLEKMNQIFSLIALLSSLLSIATSSTTIIPSPSQSIVTEKTSVKYQNPSAFISTLPEVAVKLEKKESSITSLPYSSVTRVIDVATEKATKEPTSIDLQEQSKEIVSFGIRSFTVEISTEEKRSTTTAPNKTKQTTSNLPSLETSPSSVSGETLSSSTISAHMHDAITTENPTSSVTKTAKTVKLNAKHSQQTFMPNAVTDSISSLSNDNVLNSNLNILFNDDEEGETSALNEMRYNRAEPGSHENEILNEINTGKNVYRIKIGEITTDEFHSGMNFKEFQGQRQVNGDKLPSDIPVHHEQLKVNINDFFPSKMEDFKPIIEISNQKILKDKNVLHNEQVRPGFTIKDKVKSGTRINTSNIDTTDIEIELLVDTLSSHSDGDDKSSRIDEITRVEEPVMKVESQEASKISVDNPYIPRRTKKLDPSMKSNTQGFKRLHDFGMTKFSPAEANKTQNNVLNRNPEFSTTKFYNSKESYSEILIKNKISPKPSSSSPSYIKSGKSLKQSEVPVEVLSAITMKQQPVLTSTEAQKELFNPATSHPRILSRLQEKLNLLDCDLQNLSADMTVWRGNETHELNLPITTPEKCSSGSDCLPMIISWEASAEIQSGDVLIVEIDDKFLVPAQKNKTDDKAAIHHNTAAVYQVTRLGHEHCDITEGELLDITPLIVDGRKLVTLYDKDLTEGINLLIVVSELWDQQCVRLRVDVKSDNCGENAECSGKGICFSNNSMEGFECECCTGFAGPHCEEIDACTPSPCTNNGICVDLSQGHEGHSYQCLCPYGYTGKNCETETDPCSPPQCLNGGTCVTNTTHFRIANSTFPFRCECLQGYTGPLCQHNLNECESSPCIHGICVDQEDGFRCFCQPGFSGDLCNFEYNECDSNPCINGGQCIDHIGGFSCQCTKGYQGKRCHIKIDFCAKNPCEDGYRCVDHGDEYSCVCPGTGDHNVPCDEVPRTLCATNPCANGGTCWTSDESFYCACRPGFIGKMCEDDFVVDTVVSSSELLSDISDPNVITFEDPHESLQDNASSEVQNAYIAAGIIVGAMIALAFLVIVVRCKLNESYRKISINYRQLIPFFNRDVKNAQDNQHSKHWLRGKSSSFFEENHINLKNNSQLHHSQCSSSNFFNGPLQTNLENDMYSTVDFSESQQSLIQ